MKKFEFEPLTREQIKDYCQASGDWNKIHHDEEFAKAAGLPSVIAHGMLTMGLLSRALEEWGYSSEKLAHFESKFKDKALPGDILTAEVVTETKKDSGLALDLRIINSSGAEILSAFAEYRT